MLPYQVTQCFATTVLFTGRFGLLAMCSSGAPMNLSNELVKSTYSADDVEAGKDCCRSIVESIVAVSISLQSWEYVMLSLAKSSVVKSCKAGTDPESLFDITAHSVAPNRGKGTWQLNCVRFHPDRLMFLEELGILKELLNSVLDLNAEANSDTLAIDSVQMVQTVLEDINKLVNALEKPRD